MTFVYFERGIEAFEIIDQSNLETIVKNSLHSMQTLKIDGSEIPHTSIKTKKGEAKQKELVLWEKIKKFTMKDKTISTVFTKSNKCTKPHLVAKGFQGKEDQNNRLEMSL